MLDTVAVHDEGNGELAFFAVNRSTEVLPLDLDLRGMPAMAGVAHTSLAGGTEPAATNTEADPHRVTPRDLRTPTLRDGRCSVQLPAVSWNLLRFASRP